jgi:hypothetical protein
MPDKDPYNSHVSSHFKDIHVTRPAPKPISSWTDSELSAGAHRQRDKMGDASRIMFNPKSSSDAQSEASATWSAAQDSSEAIAREATPRIIKKLGEMQDKYKATAPARNKPRPV